MAVHTSNPNTQEMDTGSGVQGRHQLYSKVTSYIAKRGQLWLHEVVSTQPQTTEPAVVAVIVVKP